VQNKSKNKRERESCIKLAGRELGSTWKITNEGRMRELEKCVDGHICGEMDQ
jgi:hypothetical protein